MTVSLASHRGRLRISHQVKPTSTLHLYFRNLLEQPKVTLRRPVGVVHRLLWWCFVRCGGTILLSVTCKREETGWLDLEATTAHPTGNPSPSTRHGSSSNAKIMSTSEGSLSLRMATGGSSEILEAGYDGSSIRMRRADPTKTVIIVGMPGTGKSNLANRLLDHPVNDPFEEGKGTTTTTRIKQVEFNDLVVVDTPGMPNKDSHKTVAYFDAVVQAMRREDSLSTLLFLVKQEVACPSEFKQYSVLLEQFNHIPCSKLMVCRQPVLSRKSKKTEAEKRYEGAKYVERVLEASRLNMPLMLLTDGYGNEAFQQVEEIVNFVLRSERVRVDAPTCRTSEELKHFVSRLADKATRLETLKQDVEEAEMSLWNRTLWMASQVVPLAYLSVASVGAGFLWTGPYVKREQETCTELRVAIMKKKKELERGVVDDEGLQTARNVLSILEDFSRNP